MPAIIYLPLNELLTAAVPTERRRVRSRRADVAALWEPEIPVPGVRPYIQHVMDYARTGMVMGQRLQLTNIRRKITQPVVEGSEPFVGRLEIRGLYGVGEASYTVPCPRLLSGDWEDIAAGWQIKVDQLLPTVGKHDDGSVAINWEHPILYRRTEGWLRRWTTVGMQQLIVSSDRGRPVMTGLSGKLVEPQLIWGDQTQSQPTGILSLDVAQLVVGSRTRTRDRWELAQEGVEEYLVVCQQQYRTPTPDGAWHYTHQRTVGIPVAGPLLWALVRWILWQVIRGVFEDMCDTNHTPIGAAAVACGGGRRGAKSSGFRPW